LSIWRATDYMAMMLANISCMQKETESRLNVKNMCYHLVQIISFYPIYS
jgi:hypothetical protein